MSAGSAPYPVYVEGRLDPGLCRWLWLVKWLLVIPHYIVLAFLWLAFAVLSVFAFFGILITGRYPHGMFEFNVGVLRWSWRVAFYAFAANGTDRYPPFTLSAADYPADLDVGYPAHLSRGLVLVKWWLLAIPHYIVLAIFLGGGAWAASSDDGVYGAGLISVLVFIAVIVLLFTGRYPRGIFDLVLGMNRWVLRVAAYAGLMTDRYPPFRLDMGGEEPGAITLAPGARDAATPPAVARSAPPNGGRLALIIVGSVLALIAAAVLATGGAGLVLDQTQRDDQGFLMTPADTYSTATYALVSEPVEANFDGPNWVSTDLLGTIKLRSQSPGPVFVGIGPADAVDRYLEGVPREELRDLGGGTQVMRPGTARPAPPERQDFWAARTSGSGDQALRWKLREGDWRAVVMSSDGARGVRSELSVGARFPDLGRICIALLGGSALLLAAGGTMLYLGARSR
jgi:hypothetical protein